MSGVSLVQPDIALHLDDQGVIREASLSDGITDEALASWIGRPWGETIGRGDAASVLTMIEDARSRGISAVRHLVQRFPSGREMVIGYTTVRVPGKHGGLLALGRNQPAVAELQSRLVAEQQATEREYWKLREVETRYRLLFDASTEAVLMIDDDLRIVEANPAAMRALGFAPGSTFPGSVPARELDAFLAMLRRVREHGRAAGIVLHLGAAMASWAVRASLMPAEPALRYLLNLAPAGGVPAQRPAETLPMVDLIERLPDGFVVVGPDGVILSANQAFVDLAQVGTVGAVRGESLGCWLSQPGADATVLLAGVQRHETVRMFQTVLHGELGTQVAVEISAAAATEGKLRFCGVLVRDVGRRLRDSETPGVEAMMDGFSRQLGREPLLDMVRTAADAIERRLIGEALERVGGNRTAAADLLGLSRQSLHTKLNRYAGPLSEAGEGLIPGD
ncbi:MAG: transcriptional regulator PpsR [Acetobacteraceae bacterium]